MTYYEVEIGFHRHVRMRLTSYVLCTYTKYIYYNYCEYI